MRTVLGTHLETLGGIQHGTTLNIPSVQADTLARWNDPPPAHCMLFCGFSQPPQGQFQGHRERRSRKPLHRTSTDRVDSLDDHTHYIEVYKTQVVSCGQRSRKAEHVSLMLCMAVLAGTEGACCPKPHLGLGTRTVKCWFSAISKPHQHVIHAIFLRQKPQQVDFNILKECHYYLFASSRWHKYS